MNVGNSIRKSIDDWEANELESAMLHACNSVDGTAKKLYPTENSGNARFTRLLRENYNILSPMGVPGINLTETRFPVKVSHPKASGGLPDIADVIYGIHRCSHGHGDELPEGFDLIPSSIGITVLKVEKGKVQLSDRLVFGLLAVAVLSNVNTTQRVPDSYFLSFGKNKFVINEWWGRTEDFISIIKHEEPPQITINFDDWMEVCQP